MTHSVALRLQGQADLFASTGEMEIDTSFGRAFRTPLNGTSWVELVPGWLSGSEELFDQLARGVRWQQHRRYVFGQWFHEPRLTAEYHELRDMRHRQLMAAAAVLSDHYGTRYDSVWLNLYRDGRDSTGWHRDRFSCRRPECIVPGLTLGTARRFLIKPRHGGGSAASSPGLAT
jgi:alkylated DNA repair dioxygenase AlkB